MTGYSDWQAAQTCLLPEFPYYKTILFTSALIHALHDNQVWYHCSNWQEKICIVEALLTPMGSPSRGGGVSWLSLPTPFSPISVCPSAYRNLSPVLLFTHQLLPAHLQFSSSDCPFCLHRPFTYISLLYKPSFCHFSFSHTLSVPRSRKMLAFWAGRKLCIYAQQ